MSRIVLHIDRLVLPEMGVPDRAALVEGLKGGLARALADPATRAGWARSHRTPVLRLGRMPLEPGTASGGKFGAGLGASIGRGLKP